MNSFPEKKFSKKYIENNLNRAYKEIPKWNEDSFAHRLGFAMTEPDSTAVETINKFLPLNNNNTGMHSNKDVNELTGTRKLEYQSINWLKNLVNLKSGDGYISSGGTEGNITGLWIARNKFVSENKKTCVIASELTHVSVKKASNLLNIPLFNAEIDNNFRIDEKKLLSLINKLYLEYGYTGFVLFLTAGYYSTGTSDAIDKINKELNKIKNSFEKLSFHIHVDAAFGGFVYPFSNPSFKFDFRNSLVETMTLDPHKMGLMPYSCGVFLCRKGLTKHIQSDNAHASVIDQTLIGSRSGSIAAGLWALIASKGRKEYSKIVKECLMNKKYFIKKLKDLDKNAEFFGDEFLNNFAVSFSDNMQFSSEVKEKYRLVENNGLYHFYLMPHITKTVIDKFIKDFNNKK